MMNSQPDLRACPSPHSLSAWIDGDADAAVARHIEQCPVCGEVVRNYRRIDAATVRVCRPPSDLADRIKVACRQAPASEPLRFPFLGVMAFWRLAAAALVPAVLLAAVLVVSRSGDAVPAVAEATVQDETAPTPAEALVAADSGIPAPVNSVNVTRTSAGRPVSINANDLIMANANGLSAPSGFGMQPGRSAEILPYRVRHVWVVDEPTRARAFLLENLPGGTPTMQTAGDGSRASFQILLQDRQLQGLIDALASPGGWSLVSPMSPQPGHGQDVIFTGKSVLYDLDLVSDPARRKP